MVPSCPSLGYTWGMDIRTASGDIFTAKEHAELARLIYRRWGSNIEAAANAWRRLFQNSTTEKEFEKLLAGEYAERVDQ